jgi:hypothetical protein
MLSLCALLYPLDASLRGVTNANDFHNATIDLNRLDRFFDLPRSGFESREDRRRIFIVLHLIEERHILVSQLLPEARAIIKVSACYISKLDRTSVPEGCRSGVIDFVGPGGAPALGPKPREA